MNASKQSQLNRLAASQTLERLCAMGFGWSRLEQNAAAALRFKIGETDAPTRILGLIGGASSGKSTLFNSLLGREASRISAHAHETLGPVAAAHADRFEDIASAIDRNQLFSDLQLHRLNGEAATSGQVGELHICKHELTDAANVILVDLPDVTSKMSDDEGAVTRNLLPWFDGLIVVVDEERWFDAQVFEETMSFSRNLGPICWIMFNRTERSEPLDPDDESKLARHAAAQRSAGYCVSPYAPGSGYRPLVEKVQSQITRWMAELHDRDRKTNLEQFLRRRCGDMLSENLTRTERFNAMRRAIERETAELADATRLTNDLLTDEERGLLGLGRRFVPLYGAIEAVRRRVSQMGLLKGAFGGGKSGVDFEKNQDAIANTLQRNLEHRFRHATDAIDGIIIDSDYNTDRDEKWQPEWRLPEIDSVEWSARIRANIEAWKTEAVQQARRSDTASIAFGMPLLLADLLFLGGAGVTLTWATAWVAGFLGGKGLIGLLEKSTAFQDYQTTVRAYQALVRESLESQCEANLQNMPRRHLSMTDPITEAMVAWSNPGRDAA